MRRQPYIMLQHHSYMKRPVVRSGVRATIPGPACLPWSSPARPGLFPSLKTAASITGFRCCEYPCIFSEEKLLSSGRLALCHRFCACIWTSSSIYLYYTHQLKDTTLDPPLLGSHACVGSFEPLPVARTPRTRRRDGTGETEVPEPDAQGERSHISRVARPMTSIDQRCRGSVHHIRVPYGLLDRQRAVGPQFLSLALSCTTETITTMTTAGHEWRRLYERPTLISLAPFALLQQLHSSAQHTLVFTCRQMQ